MHRDDFSTAFSSTITLSSTNRSRAETGFEKKIVVTNGQFHLSGGLSVAFGKFKNMPRFVN